MPFTAKGIKKLAAHHGLDPETNTDDDIDNCIKNAVTDDDMEDLTNRAEAGDAVVAELKELRDATAESDLKVYANKIGDSPEAKKFWKQSLLTNRSETVAALEKMPAAGAAAVVKQKQPLHNRAEASTPKEIENAGNGQTEQKVLANKIRARTKDLMLNAKNLGHKPDYNLCFRQAQSELASA